MAQLAAFDLDIRYRPRKSNQCADALSRYPGNEDSSPANDEHGDVCSLLPVDIVREPVSSVQTESTLSPCVFLSYSYEQLATIQKKDDALGVVWRYLQSGWTAGYNLDPCTSEVKGCMKEYSKFREFQGVPYGQVMDKHSGISLRLLVPHELRKQLLQMAHDEWGHQGINRTNGILQTRCFWPGLHNDVKSHVKNCFTCVTTKTHFPQVRTPQRHLLAFRPLELVAIDFLKLDKGKGGFEDVLVVTDAFTKFSPAIPCRNQMAVEVAKKLRDNWLSQYGAPLRIHSDQGRNFEFPHP